MSKIPTFNAPQAPRQGRADIETLGGIIDAPAPFRGACRSCGRRVTLVRAAYCPACGSSRGVVQEDFTPGPEDRLALWRELAREFEPCDACNEAGAETECPGANVAHAP